jgi:hypothetical protein
MSERCQATTESGGQCQHDATDGDYCWIHGGEETGTRAGEHQYDVERMADALRHSDSFAEAAQRMGCHPTTVSKYADEVEVCRAAWKPKAVELTGIGRNTLRHLANNADDESVRLRAAKLLISNYDAEQVPDKTDVTSGGDKVNSPPVVRLPDNGKREDGDE